MGYHTYINLLEVSVLGCPKKSFSCVMKFLCDPGYPEWGSEFRKGVLSLWDVIGENRGIKDKNCCVKLQAGGLLEERETSMGESWRIAAVLLKKYKNKQTKKPTKKKKNHHQKKQAKTMLDCVFRMLLKISKNILRIHSIMPVL